MKPAHLIKPNLFPSLFYVSKILCGLLAVLSFINKARPNYTLIICLPNILACFGGLNCSRFRFVFWVLYWGDIEKSYAVLLLSSIVVSCGLSFILTHVCCNLWHLYLGQTSHAFFTVIILFLLVFSYVDYRFFDGNSCIHLVAF